MQLTQDASKPTSKIVRLEVIPKSDKTAKTAIILSSYKPAFKVEKEGYNYVCGFCDTLLAEDVGKEQIQNKVILCFECLKYNKCA
jgi:hypothetical protein